MKERSEDRPDIETAPVAGPRAPVAAAGGTRSRTAALARAIADGVPLSNRSVSRMLQRDEKDDDPYSDPVPMQTQTPAPPAGADSDAGAGALSTFRAAILAEALKLVPAKEPEAKFYSGAGTDAAGLQKVRDEAAAKGAKHTTCIDFQGVVTSRASLKAKGKLIRLTGITADVVYPKAWTAATEKIAARPNPGDVYVLHKTANRSKFSHTGIIRRIERPPGGGVETWHTIDGGQGSQPHEEHKENVRYYHPDTNNITGEANQGDADAFLWGWVNVDLL